MAFQWQRAAANPEAFQFDEEDLFNGRWKQWPIEAQVWLNERLGQVLGVGQGFKERYRDDPVAFAADCVDFGDDAPGLTPYQTEILTALVEKRRVAVRGPHGLGKTMMASLAILWFALTRDGDDWKIPTTASAWRQLTEFLWPEVHKWSRKLRWNKIERGPFTVNELQSITLKLSTGRAFAMASSDESFTEGAHADHLLYLFDEAKAIPDSRFDAAEGALMTGNTYALAISTPGEPVGRFYDIHRRAPGYEDWWVRHVTLQECIAAGRITQKDADQRKLQWGEDSAIYHNRVLGEFKASDEDAVIPLAWVEAAVERWSALVGTRNGHWYWKSSDGGPPLDALGIDISRSEAGDKTVLARRHGNVITQIDSYSTADTMHTVGKASGILAENPQAYAVVDVIGLGGGPVDRLREIFNRKRIDDFNASESAGNAKDRSGEIQFANKRAHAWWHMRELLDPAYHSEIALPPIDTLIGDLTTVRRGRMTSSGKLTIESKEDVRKRIKRSTNDGDAVIQAFYPRKKEPQQSAACSYSYVGEY